MIPRLFCAGSLAIGQEVALPDGPARHARDVLRPGTGDRVTLLNGLGGEYAARLAEVTKKEVRATVLDFSRREAESPYPITVAQCLAGGDKMDWIVEKSVELGASTIVPLAAARSVLRLSPERAAKRLDHWRAIAQSACEQCGRNRVTTIEPVASLGAWLAGMRDRPGIKLMLSPVHSTTFSSLPSVSPGTSVTLLIGPEAGLTDAEETQAQAAEFVPVLLGPRVLRTETAALAALAAINARWGDF